MALMQWDDALALNDEVIDSTHREFVRLLNRMYEAGDDEMLAVLDEFIAHSESHFGQEQRWMEELEFPPLACHVREHEGVMEIAREVRRRAAGGETAYGRVLAEGVAQWFVDHATSMDLVLAEYIKEKDYVVKAG